MKTATKLTELQAAVKNYLTEKVEENYTEKKILEDLQKHGCISGMVCELIYYSDTVKFYDKHKTEIHSLIEQYCNNNGIYLRDFFQHAVNFPLDKYQTQNCVFAAGIKDIFKIDKDVNDQIKNWLAWFGFEEMANKYYSEKYDN